MNCKPGDLAIVVASDFGDLGRIVRCERRLCAGDVLDGIQFHNPGETWVVDQLMTYISNQLGVREAHIAPDESLRPIRDHDGEDETLSWAPVPVKEIA